MTALPCDCLVLSCCDCLVLSLLFCLICLLAVSFFALPRLLLSSLVRLLYILLASEVEVGPTTSKTSKATKLSVTEEQVFLRKWGHL
jgi:hypothetical protein